MIVSSKDIGVKKIMYVKHWLRSLSLLFLVLLFICIFLLLFVCYHVMMVKQSCIYYNITWSSFENFHQNSCKRNWNDFSSERLTGQASTAYNRIGMHLDFIKCIILWKIYSANHTQTRSAIARHQQCLIRSLEHIMKLVDVRGTLTMTRNGYSYYFSLYTLQLPM